MTDISAFPLAPASVDGTSVTLDMFVKEPTRISSYIAENVQASLVSQWLFTSTAATGGALLFDVNDAKPSNDINENPGVIAPGGEYPLLGGLEARSEIERVKKTGGKFFVTDEAVKRNRPEVLQRKAIQVANKMVKDIDGRGFAYIQEYLDKFDDALTYASKGLVQAADVTKGNATAKTGTGQLGTDITEAQLLVDDLDMGYQANTLITTKRDAANMQILAGGPDEWNAFLAQYGLTHLKSNALEDGTALLVDPQAIGEMGVEDPISTKTYREEANDLQWFQTKATMAFGVTDPLSVVTITGLEK